MITRQRKQTALHRVWMPVVTAAFLGYFGFHAYSGSYGIRAMEQFERERIDTSLRLGYLKSQRRLLEQRISAVRPESLNTEIVDMHARMALNMLRADEIVIERGAVQ